MLAEKSLKLPVIGLLLAKLADYVQLVKIRLNLLVVFSAGISYLFAARRAAGFMSWADLLLLFVGGFLVTGSANGFNQVLEVGSDRLMKRTRLRPLPAGRMTVVEAVIVSTIMGVLGVLILGYGLNTLTALFGVISLLLYAFVYTPLKKVGRIAVYIGAIPGAMPPLLGYIAFSNHFGLEPGVLFAIQFVWQFPHFWAIAWVLDDDYQRAGFRLLPANTGANKKSALINLIVTMSIIPMSIIPVYLGMSGYLYAIIAFFAGCYFSLRAFKLYQKCHIDQAKRLMFASFIYLPLVQIALLMDKL